MNPIFSRAAGTGPDADERIVFELTTSSIYPGTSRTVIVRLPAAYRPHAPARCLVWLGSAGTSPPGGIPAPEGPPILTVEVGPGVLVGSKGGSHPNVGAEWLDGGDAFARFLLEEVFPAVEARSTEDRGAIRLPSAPADVMVAGRGEAAVAAFFAAWHRPERFARVLCLAGAFDSLRGARNLPWLIRLTEPKPLRVFLEAGGRAGPEASPLRNLLEEAGYEVNPARSDPSAGGPDDLAARALSWGWAGRPSAPEATAVGNPTLREVLLPGEGWVRLGEGYRFSEGATVDREGVVYFNDIQASVAYRIELDGRVVPWREGTQRSLGQTIGPDGVTLYAASWGVPQLFCYGPERRPEVFLEGQKGNDVISDRRGNLYLTNPVPVDPLRPGEGRVWLVRPDSTKVLVDEGLRFPNGLALSPDGSLLYVNDWDSHWVYRYVVGADGLLAHRQRFIPLLKTDAHDGAGSDGMRVDTKGRLWVATHLGIQIFDADGRALAILPGPSSRVSHLCFGGPDFDTLVVTTVDAVHRRRLKVRGTQPWD